MNQPPAAEIRIAMGPDGQIRATCTVPNRRIFLMMMETGKFDLERKLYEQEQEAKTKVVMPPVGIDVSQLRG